jgi:hypothetical protein
MEIELIRMEQQYYDEQSDRHFDNLGELAEHYDDYSDYYEISGLPDVIYVCELRTIEFDTAKNVAYKLLEDFHVEQKSDSCATIYRDWATAENLAGAAGADFYWNCDNDYAPPFKGIEDLQRSLQIFNAINKPFWRLGGDSMIGLCIIDRALRKIERENAEKHCLWYPTKEHIELTDRVWQSLKMQNWKLIDGEWKIVKTIWDVTDGEWRAIG